jgi:hypothetical protein
MLFRRYFPISEVAAMFTLLKTLSLRVALTEQLPVMGVAWIIAELFYKFHSFTLECAAFLVTWYVLDAALFGVKRMLGRSREAH